DGVGLAALGDRDAPGGGHRGDDDAGEIERLAGEDQGPLGGEAELGEAEEHLDALGGDLDRAGHRSGVGGGNAEGEVGLVDHRIRNLLDERHAGGDEAEDVGEIVGGDGGDL